MNVLKRAALTAALVAASFATQSADAAVGGCARSWVSTVVIYPERFVDCTLTSSAVCLYFYDPVAHPVQNNVVPQTVLFARCVAA